MITVLRIWYIRSFAWLIMWPIAEEINQFSSSFCLLWCCDADPWCAHFTKTTSASKYNFSLLSWKLVDLYLCAPQYVRTIKLNDGCKFIFYLNIQRTVWSISKQWSCSEITAAVAALRSKRVIKHLTYILYVLKYIFIYIVVCVCVRA